jgi:sugar fermentation stimulation protein A
LINIDSQAPNTVIWEGIRANKIEEIRDIKILRKEVTFSQSRFDLFFESFDNSKGFIEIKGVTLENQGTAMFPDAPTVRGTKHVREMIQAVQNGFQGFIVFLVQMKGIKYFTPNSVMDKNFSEALKAAKKAGVKILAFDSEVKPNEITFGEKVSISL